MNDKPIMDHRYPPHSPPVRGPEVWSNRHGATVRAPLNPDLDLVFRRAIEAAYNIDMED